MAKSRGLRDATPMSPLVVICGPSPRAPPGATMGAGTGSPPGPGSPGRTVNEVHEASPASPASPAIACADLVVDSLRMDISPPSLTPAARLKSRSAHSTPPASTPPTRAAGEQRRPLAPTRAAGRVPLPGGLGRTTFIAPCGPPGPDGRPV